jgi:hypothetical protein
MPNFGKRPDGTDKSYGYMGVLKNRKGQSVTEFSVGIDGEDIPTVVPTLTKEELQHVLDASADRNIRLSDTVVNKAITHAQKRKKEGKSPFWNEAEDGKPVTTIDVQKGKLGGAFSSF